MSATSITVYICVITASLAATAAEEDGKDVPSVAGAYVRETDPDNGDPTNYMTAMVQKDLYESKKDLFMLSKLNQTHWNIYHLIRKDRMYNISFESGKEFIKRLDDGREKRNTITIDEKGSKAHRLMRMIGFELNQDVVFSKKGFVLTMRAKNSTATLEYSRWVTKHVEVQDIVQEFRSIYFGESVSAANDKN